MSKISLPGCDPGNAQGEQRPLGAHGQFTAGGQVQITAIHRQASVLDGSAYADHTSVGGHPVGGVDTASVAFPAPAFIAGAGQLPSLS